MQIPFIDSSLQIRRKSVLCFILFVLFIMLIFEFIYFVGNEDEAGKQVRSAVRIKNSSKSHVAFKVSILFAFAIQYLNYLMEYFHIFRWLLINSFRT